MLLMIDGINDFQDLNININANWYMNRTYTINSAENLQNDPLYKSYENIFVAKLSMKLKWYC